MSILPTLAAASAVVAAAALVAIASSWLDAGRLAPAVGSIPSPLSDDGGDAFRIADATIVAKLTGVDSLSQTASRWNVHGTDLGHMFRHRDELYMVFGDTYGPGGLGGRHWRSNVMARIADSDPRSGLPFASMITRADGFAKELLPSRKIPGWEYTVIPTYGISVDGRMYLHYMSVRAWGAPGSWFVGHSGLAYSDDDGRTWRKSPTARWPGGGLFDQVAMVEHEGFVFSFGIPQGRFGAVHLRRVTTAGMLDPSAYEYWTGSGWSARVDDAQLVVPQSVGELSVRWSEHHERWLMTYLDVPRGAVVLRTAPELTGPWDAPRVVMTAQRHPGLYGPYMVPGIDVRDELYFTVSLWEPYNVYLVRARIETAPPAGGDPGATTAR